MARNIAYYAGHGEIRLGVVDRDGRRALAIEAADDGPGIADIEQAMEDGYSTSGGLGLGLPGARRMTDDFEVVSEGAAADAAHRATDIVAQHPAEPLRTLFGLCHEALAVTRGCAMTLTRIGLDDGSLGWLGVGNVAASLIRMSVDGSVSRQSALLRGGVVGYQLPPQLHVRHTVMLPGDLLLIGTDGLASDFAENTRAGQPTGELATYILEHCAKGTDDALILALRNRGPSS